MSFLGSHIDNSLVRDCGLFGGVVFTGWLIVVVYVLRPSFALPLFIGLIATSVVGYALKAIVKIPRPDAVNRPAPQTFFEQWDASTFPSVHTMRIATILGLLIGRFTRVADIVLAVMLISVALSRMVTRRHRFIDVVVGAALGLAVALAVRFVL